MSDNTVQQVRSLFTPDGRDWLVWIITFDGMHYVADIAHQTTNSLDAPDSLFNFLGKLIDGQDGQLQLDDEGDFFGIDAKFLDDKLTVVLTITEARDGRTAEVSVKAQDFLQEVLTSIGQVRQTFSHHKSIEYSIIDDADNSVNEQLYTIVDAYIQKWGEPTSWSAEGLGISPFLKTQ